MSIFKCVMMAACWVGVLASVVPAQEGEPYRVPGFTAYSEPRPDGIDISGRRGGGWRDESQHLLFFGRFAEVGEVNVVASVTLPKDATSRVQLTLAGATVARDITGAGEDQPTQVDFGSFKIAAPGYQKLSFAGLARSGASFGAFKELVLTGSATRGVVFNQNRRRNATSVHLGYPVPKEVQVDMFYNEVTPTADPLNSYYMACGFNRGYFGMQVNSPTERRFIFSIWDSGGEAIDRKKVAQDDRVKLLAKGENVNTGDFGNEGTGGHSHLVFPWKTGDTYKFLVTATAQDTHTIYTGYVWLPETHAWRLISRFQAPKDGKYLRGLYSFNEDFWGTNGHQKRYALFGPQWIHTTDGQWIELTKARFTTDGNVQKRSDFGAGVIEDRFFLTNGGFEKDIARMGDVFERKPTGKAPDITQLPEVKPIAPAK